MKTALTIGTIAGGMLALAALPASAGPASISIKDMAASTALSAPVIKAGARVGRSRGLGIGLGLGAGLGLGIGHKKGVKVGAGAGVKLGTGRHNGLNLGLGLGTRIKVGHSRKRRRW